MPMPLSSTSRTAWPLTPRTRSWIAPLAGVYLMALSSRLTTTCLSRDAVAFHRNGLAGVAGNGNVLVLGQQTHLLGGGFGEFGQVEPRPFGLRLAGVEPREREQLLHDFAQMHDLLQHAAGAVAQFRIEPRRLPARFSSSPRRIVSGVRKSCEASATNRLEF